MRRSNNNLHRLRYSIIAEHINSAQKVEVKKSRPGVHAKTKTSKSKNSANYKKKYRGQGR